MEKRSTTVPRGGVCASERSRRGGTVRLVRGRFSEPASQTRPSSPRPRDRRTGIGQRRPRRDSRHTVEPYTCGGPRHGVLAAARIPVCAGLVVGSRLAPGLDRVSSDRNSWRWVHPAGVVECDSSLNVFRRRTGAALRRRLNLTRVYWRFRSRCLVDVDSLSVPESQEASGTPFTPLGDSLRSPEKRSFETRPRKSLAVRKSRKPVHGRRTRPVSARRGLILGVDDLLGWSPTESVGSPIPSARADIALFAASSLP